MRCVSLHARGDQFDLGLTCRTAIVLGGTCGIGRAIAQTLAVEGANVALCGRNADQVTATVAELAATGIRATGSAFDIADGAPLKSWIETAAGDFGGIDMLFSNAGAMLWVSICCLGSETFASTCLAQ
jgi:3-oxoacyl-[acyl-carrier protein] reductase